MVDHHPIVTVRISGTIYAQGPTVAPVSSCGVLPTDKRGLLAIRTGETTISVERPLLDGPILKTMFSSFQLKVTQLT